MTTPSESEVFYRMLRAGKEVSLAVARNHRLSQADWTAMQHDLLVANLPTIFRWRWAHAGCGRAWEQARQLGVAK